MAHFDKVKSSGVHGCLGHNCRELSVYSNDDIDESRSYLNWDLTPEHDDFIPTETRECDQKLEYFESLKEDNYFYNRPTNVQNGVDRGTTAMMECVVTLPTEVWDMCHSLNRGIEYPDTETEERIKDFFETTVDFFCERYGQDNIISAIVHFDEGVKRPIIERDFFGNALQELDDNGRLVPVYERDENGEIKYEFVSGNPHIHIDIAPIMKEGQSYYKGWDFDNNCGINETEIHLTEKQLDNGYEGKFACTEMFNRPEFITFHHDYQQYLYDHDVDVNVLTGKTGINFTVEQLKAGVKEAFEKYQNEFIHVNQRRN